MKKITKEQDIDKKISRKYVFLGSFLWVIFTYILYSYIKNYEKIKYFEGFLLASFSISIYLFVIYLIRKSVSRHTTIKINIWCLYSLLIYYLITILYIFNKAVHCPIPFEKNFKLYQECRKPIDMISHMMGNYGSSIFICLLIYTSFLLFKKNNTENKKNISTNIYLLFFTFLLILILPLQISYLLFNN